MALTNRGTDVANSGTTSASPTWVAGSVGDVIVANITCKPYTSTPTGPDGTWTQQGTATSGTVANAVSSGSTRATAFTNTATATGTGSAAFSVTSGSPTIGRCTRVGADSGAMAILTAGLADTDESLLSVSATGSVASGDLTTNDLLIIQVALKDNAITHTTQSLSVAGCTLNTITWASVATTTSGNDGAQYIGVVTVASGSSTGSVTYAATSNTAGASAAAVTVTRIREVLATPTGLAASGVSSSQVDVSWNSVTSATGYVLERSPNGTTGWTTVFSGAGTSYSDTGLSAATTYYYRVSATGSLQTSSVSSTVNGTTYVTIPFLEDFVGGSWARWTDSTIGSSPSGLTVSSGAGVMTAADETKFARAALRVASQATQGVLLKFTSSTSGFFKLWLRSDTFGSGADPSNGAGLRVQPGGSLSFFDAVGGVVTSRSAIADSDSGTSSPSTSTSYWLRFEAIGTNYRWHMWLTTDPEPTGWRTPNSPSASIPATGILMMSETTSGVGSPQSSITVDDILFYDPTLKPGPAKVGKVGAGLYLNQAVAGGVR